MGEKIKIINNKLNIPDNPIIPFIEGDGTGVDIWPASRKVFDAAVDLSYKGKKKISWLEIFAGEKAFNKFQSWLPKETIDTIREYRVAIKGPLTTPVGGGIRSLNVALRQELDLFACVRPVRYFDGVPSPVKYPERVNMIIFRENTEDVYAGFEWESGSKNAENIINFLNTELKTSIRAGSGIGIKPVSKFGSQRLVRSAIQYAIQNKCKSVTLVHKGNIMKFTEGAFKKWGYDIAETEFADKTINWDVIGNTSTDKIIIKDVIADSMFQQVLTKPEDYSVIATLNLDGDYLSDALAAQVGGLGIAPGANIGDNIAVFEATHGTAPKYAGQDKVNPGSLILSGAMMLDYLGWNASARLVENALAKTIKNKTVTYDLHRMIENAKLLKCSEFGEEIIKAM